MTKDKMKRDALVNLRKRHREMKRAGIRIAAEGYKDGKGLERRAEALQRSIEKNMALVVAMGMNNESAS